MRIRMLVVGACLAVLVPGAVLAQSDTLIVPGVRIGPVALGMFREDVMRLLGRPDKVEENRATQGGTVVVMSLVDHYTAHGLAITYGAGVAPAAFFLATESPRYATDQGVRVGSSGTDLVRAHGSGCESCQKAVCYMGFQGVMFEVWKAGQVRRIAVERGKTCL